LIDRFWLGVEKRLTSELIGIMKTLNVRQRHSNTFLNAINNKTRDPPAGGPFFARPALRENAENPRSTIHTPASALRVK